jgi:predicted permease
MRWLAWLASGIGSMFRRAQIDRDTRAELQFHLDARTRDLERRGLPASTARRIARAELGGVDRCVERTREAWGFRLLSDLRQDIGHALRMFTASPGVTSIAILSVAIGVGANASIFSIADALVFRPLGVRDPNAVVTVGIAPPEEARGTGYASYPNYLDLRAGVRSFDGLVADQLVTFGFTASRGALPDMRMGMAVSDNFFSVLGVTPAIGRAFAAGEGQVADRDPVLVLGHDFWNGALGADRSIVGREVWVNGVAMKVIGVAPERFSGMDQYLRPAFFLPATMLHRLSRGEDRSVSDRKSHDYELHGRLAPGVSIAHAQADVAAAWSGLVLRYPDVNRHRNVMVRTELQTRFRNTPEDAVMMVLLLALVALVLAIACANVANLLLGRARARAKEMAIRLALGVARPRLLRQLMTESALLAVAGCALGIGLAAAGIRFLSDIRIPTDLPVVIEPYLDERVLLFSLGAAAASALLFGLAPAFASLRTDLVTALKGARQGPSARRRTVGRNVLVVIQVAMSMVLLVSSGIILEGFHKTLEMNPGFRTDHLLMMTLDTGLAGDTAEQARTFYRNVIDRAAATPGIVSVAMTGAVPLDPTGEGEYVVPEGFHLRPGQDSIGVGSATVDEHYFETMRTDIVSGRGFAAYDRAGSQPVAIVNAEFVRRFWPGQDPLGKRLQLREGGNPWATVVGLTKTGKYTFLGEAPKPFIYVPFSQHERARMSLIVESSAADAAELFEPLRQIVRDLNPNQPVYNLRTLSAFYEQRALAIPRRLFQVVMTMGLAGLALAIVGLYGLVAYSVACRTREIGIRMAMGAPRSHVLAMVLRQGAVLSTAGIAFGALASVAASRMLIAGMSGLAAPSPTSYVLVPVLLVALTLTASYVPARRASLIDPLMAVRDE